jgi:hypothetical protein
MRFTNLNARLTCLFSLALISALPLPSLRAQPAPEPLPSSPPLQLDEGLTGDNAPVDRNGAAQRSQQSQISDLETKIQDLEARTASKPEAPLDQALWLAGGSSLIGLLSLVLAGIAMLRVQKQRDAVIELGRRNQSLLTRIGGLEVQIEREKTMAQSRAMSTATASTTPTANPAAINTAASNPAAVNPVPPQSPAAIPQEALQPEPMLTAPTAPVVLSKMDLIAALNAGDRQALRETATAELNITSTSENAIATGRSQATELEEVPGGGSYWLILIQGQHWLFPTERTLKGFAAAQPAKGLFHYEQRVISQPQLIEPALIENNGKAWTIKTMGLIATP